MLKLLIFLFLLTTTFAQSPFWKMELMESAATTTPDILTDLVALWQDGDTVDVTGRGNDLTRSHTNPTPLPDAWDDEITYNTGDLCTHLGYVFRSKQDGNTYQPEAPGAEDEWWTIHAPYKTATGLAGIDSAITFNGIDHYLSRASTSDLQLGGTDFTIAVWVKTPYNGDGFKDIIYKGDEASIIEYALLGSPNYRWSDGVNENNLETPSDNTYQFVVVKQSGGDNYLSVNCGSEATAEVTIANGSGNFILGKVILGDYNLDGSIAQLAIYKRALTQEQITYLYNGGDGRLIVP